MYITILEIPHNINREAAEWTEYQYLNNFIIKNIK